MSADPARSVFKSYQVSPQLIRKGWVNVPRVTQPGCEILCGSAKGTSHNSKTEDSICI